MEQQPKVGDLVQLRGAYFDNAIGVVTGRIYSWAAMADSFIVRVVRNNFLPAYVIFFCTRPLLASDGAYCLGVGSTNTQERPTWRR